MKGLIIAATTALLLMSGGALASSSGGAKASSATGPWVECKLPDGSVDYVPLMICTIQKNGKAM